MWAHNLGFTHYQQLLMMDSMSREDFERCNGMHQAHV